MLSSLNLVVVAAAVSAHALAATATGGGNGPAVSNETAIVVAGNLTLLSPNGTFALGFFSLDGGGSGAWYLGIWYAAIAIRTYVWVANRAAPARGPASAGITADGRLAVLDSSNALVWATDNSERGSNAELLDNGNLVLRESSAGLTVWESFENPADTWLPEMAMTSRKVITSWRSPSDPSPGPYSLRIRPPSYGEIELVFNGSKQYWSTGGWTGTRFSGVPEMTVSYIYSFRFGSPFTPEAYFVYSGAEPPDSGLRPLLTRFAVDSWGQLMQFTWSPQAGSWENFWSRPEGGCRVYGRCGSLGLCADSRLSPCRCPAGLRPTNPDSWSSGNFAGGCTNGDSCSTGDTFQPFGTAEFDGSTAAAFLGVSQSACEDSCRRNCSCFGLNYDGDAKICRTLHGAAYNLMKASESPLLYIRVGMEPGTKPAKHSTGAAVLAGSICGFVAAMVLLAVGAAALIRKKRGEEGGGTGRCRGKGKRGENIPVTNLSVFSYKEISSATGGFTEKLGHGGFGAVFRGSLPDSTEVAVKRLERAGAGDREFRAEVRTIGAVHHVNIVRLRGFCCEGPHRILVYDYMPNGPLSSFLRRGSQGPAPVPLAWPARFGIAVGTARGIAYLHEECRDCIIHCDIKPENILLDGDYSPKVSDFGLARLVGRELSRVLVTMRGTLGYVAPEWISGVAITPKADVYSYGMTLLELLGGRRNVDEPRSFRREETGAGGREEDSWFFPAWAARKIVEGGVGEVVDTALGDGHGEEAERVGRVAVWCIQDGEEARPTMGSVVKMLEGALYVPVPPLPQLLQALVARESSTRAGLVSGSAASADGRQSGNNRPTLPDEETISV